MIIIDNIFYTNGAYSVSLPKYKSISHSFRYENKYTYIKHFSTIKIYSEYIFSELCLSKSSSEEIKLSYSNSLHYSNILFGFELILHINKLEKTIKDLLE
jgi:hypothetical protein